MLSLLLAAVLTLAPPEPPAPSPITIAVQTDTPVVVTRGDATISIYADRLAILPAGAMRPIIVMLGTTPAPAPTPTPTPTPTPDPTPKPSPIAGPLTAVMVYTNDTTNADELATLAVKTDPDLGERLKGLDVTWRAWERGNPEIDAIRLRSVVQAAGFSPVLVVYDGQGSYRDASGATVSIERAAMKPPRTPDDVLALFRKLRGK